jgi:hypothetical protein
LYSSVYLPLACRSFLLPISQPPMSEIFLQLWSPFFGGNLTMQAKQGVHEQGKILFE